MPPAHSDTQEDCPRLNRNHEQTLLLDVSYQPLKIIDWKRAISLWFLGKVEILKSHAHQIASPSKEFSVPSVVRLLKSIPTKINFSEIRFSRQNVYRRDEHTCQYCHIEFSPKFLTFDHVVPRSKGGKTCWDNIVTACLACNQKKRNRTPREAGMPLKRPPRKPTTRSLTPVKKLWDDWMRDFS